MAPTHQILASRHTVHHTLGIGFLHQIYRRASRIELAQEGINTLYLKTLPLRFETQPNLEQFPIPLRRKVYDKN